MEKNPYYEDWLRKIEAMSEEELIEVIDTGDYDAEFLKLVRERLAFVRSGNAVEQEWKERAEKTIKKASRNEFENKMKYEVDNSAENTLLFFANATLFIGIIATFICFLTLSFTPKHGYYSSGKEFNPAGFGVTIGVLVSSLVTWAFMKVFVNISKTLKEINVRMPKA